MVRKASVAVRYKSLLEVNKVALTASTPQRAFQGMCAVLKRVVPYDRAVLSIYDPDDDGLKIVDVFGPYENTVFHVGRVLSRKGTQSGWTFDRRSTVLRRNLAKEYRFPIDQAAMEEGCFSCCSVPLLVRGNSIGVVTVGAGQRNPLSESHAAIVEELSNQIALALSCSALRCPTHTTTRLVCPRCIGAAGGKATVARHRSDLSTWGKKGGLRRKLPTDGFPS